MINESEIRKYAGLMDELKLTGLEITEDNKVVRLEKNFGEKVTAAPARIEEAPAPVQAKKEDTDYISVRSPMVGVFYASPAENAEPYVNIGDKVEKGKVLCIVEAMKLLNEIPSDTEGTISQICVADGQNVEYGTELFRLKR